jgi:perosamine synthetase
VIPYGRQHIDADDVAAVVSVLKGDWLTQGPHIEEFESALCRATNADHAVAFASGTAALHAATYAAELGPGDVVATSPLSFAASANCARYVGAEALFVDIDPDTLNIAVEQVPNHIDALVAVHYAGLPIDLARLESRPRVVIEDAAHALGAMTADGPVGNCSNSDMSCFSFHPVKTVTTGEGGAVTTNDARLAARLRRFRHHGIVPTPDDGGWTYDVPELGYNYRLSDLQAALGVSQLAKLGAFVERRNELAQRYRHLLSDTAVVLPPGAGSSQRHAYHLFPVRLPERRRVYDAMRAAGIGVQVHYVPTYRLGAYRHGSTLTDYPNTEMAYGQLLSLPMFPDLTFEEQDYVVGTLRGLI